MSLVQPCCPTLSGVSPQHRVDDFPTNGADQCLWGTPVHGRCPRRREYYFGNSEMSIFQFCVALQLIDLIKETCMRPVSRVLKTRRSHPTTLKSTYPDARAAWNSTSPLENRDGSGAKSTDSSCDKLKVTPANRVVSLSVSYKTNAFQLQVGRFRASWLRGEMWGEQWCYHALGFPRLIPIWSRS